MIQWNRVKRCAAGLAVTALTVPVGAESLAYPEMLQPAGYSYCIPVPNPCPPQPCVPEGLMYPHSEPSAGVPTPADSASPSVAPTPLTNPAAPAPTASAPLADALDGPSPLGLGSLSQPSGGAGFSMASAVAAAPAPGYIDYAPIATRFRLRYDNAEGSDQPTRGEFLYPTGAGFVNTKGPAGVGSGGDPFAENIDLQELSAYLEVALTDRFSVFVDAPVRWVSNVDIDDDGLNDTVSGFSDLRTGFKYALLDCCGEYLTTQFLISTPTGDADRSVGTGNTSFDIGLLYSRQLSSSTFLFGEIRDWFTLDAPTTNDGANDIDLNANILRYGAGIGVDLLDNSTCCKTRKLTGIFEVVGWTVLDGFSTSLAGGQQVRDATGDTIVNGKYGLRYTSGDHTVYVGYGHNWTSDRWYADMIRAEWGYFF
ncbi:hypothetical protein [Botrimarina hoheduenensis]|uniref:Uncharacterized protein n=1 Tax=Botrimarina hoheduenensis TaxID=2528000 RepID=A0A5C5WCQ3_9BACT|nr:hypothetical protein [Botrimarina hoheduenensis]TWT47855.1 hypothetical protein Pla111_14810 [Botrimarina hoheduenensis]